MRERESQFDRDISVDTETDGQIDAGIDRQTDAGVDGRPDLGVDWQSDARFGQRSDDSDPESGGRLRSRLGSLASTRSLLIAFVLTVAGIILFGAVPFLGIVGDILGIAAAGFLYGLGTDARRYVEMALAGALAGGGLALIGNLFVALVASGTVLVGAGLLGGAIAGIVGHYFGRDLRHGLTRDLHEG